MCVVTIKRGPKRVHAWRAWTNTSTPYRMDGHGMNTQGNQQLNAFLITGLSSQRSLLEAESGPTESGYYSNFIVPPP